MLYPSEPNHAGLDNATQMDLEAKHQIVGWGWQQNFDTVGKYTSNESTGTGLPCNKTSCGINGTLYQQETSLAQQASRFAAYCEFSPPNPEHQVCSESLRRTTPHPHPSFFPLFSFFFLSFFFLFSFIFLGHCLAGGILAHLRIEAAWTSMWCARSY